MNLQIQFWKKIYWFHLIHFILKKDMLAELIYLFNTVLIFLEKLIIIIDQCIINVHWYRRFIPEVNGGNKCNSK